MTLCDFAFTPKVVGKVGMWARPSGSLFWTAHFQKMQSGRAQKVGALHPGRPHLRPPAHFVKMTLLPKWVEKSLAGQGIAHLPISPTSK